MRTLTRAGALSAVAAAALLAAPSAHAAPIAAGLGDNGTVKIHDASTGEELRRNEPRVCTFYLDAFGFDSAQEVSWRIEAWAPSADVKGETVKSGEITLDGDGRGRTEDLSLPDGHYKLFWNFEGEKGSAKHKVFWTDCEETGGGEPGSTPSSSASPSTSASASPSESAPAQESSEPSASSSPSAQGGGGEGGDLAETGNGAPVGLLGGAAAALVAAGGYLVFRRRKTS